MSSLSAGCSFQKLCCLLNSCVAKMTTISEWEPQPLVEGTGSGRAARKVDNQHERHRTESPLSFGLTAVQMPLDPRREWSSPVNLHSVSNVKPPSLSFTLFLSSTNTGQHRIPPVTFVHVKSFCWWHPRHKSLLVQQYSNVSAIPVRAHQLSYSNG